MAVMNAQGKRVSDLQLAAFLLATECPLIGVEGTSDRKVFVFRADEENIIRFYNGNDQVSARKLMNALRDLKGFASQRF